MLDRRSMSNAFDKMLQNGKSRQLLEKKLNISAKYLLNKGIDLLPKAFIGNQLSNYLAKYNFNPDLRPKVIINESLIAVSI